MAPSDPVINTSKIEAEIQKAEADATGIWNWIKSHAVLVSGVGGLLAGFIVGLLV